MKPFLIILILLISCSSKKGEKTQTQFPNSPLETACNNGAFDTCLALGRSSEKTKPAEAEKWFEKACVLKSAVGCLSAGGVMLTLNDHEKAIFYFAKGCELNEAASCYGTGIVYSGVYGGKADHSRAVDSFRRSCELGLGDGCAQVGILGLEKSKSETERIESVEKLKAACTAKADIACYALGEHFTDMKPDQSARWFGEGCKLGDGTSCLAAGFAYATGNGVEASETKSYDLFKQGCLSPEKDWVACSLYGYADFRTATNEDEKKIATELLKSTCEKEAEGCFRMALVDSDPVWLEKACTLNTEKCDVYRRYFLKAKNK